MAEKNKYARTIQSLDGTQSIEVDVYCVLDAFPTGSAPIDHAIKKLLCGGQRGGKSREQDYQEAVQSINRALQMMQVKPKGEK